MIATLQNKDDAAAPVRRDRPGAAADDDPGKILACALCRRPITTGAARIEVGGAHAHTFTNADGDTFRVGCFGEANGLRRVSPASRADTWFAGYTWQIEVCAGCTTQLGWLYRSGASIFHGLILTDLIEITG